LVSRSSGVLGFVEIFRGHFDLAEGLLGEGVELAEAVEDDLFATYIGAFQALLVARRGDPAGATELVEHALGVAQRQQCVPSIAVLGFVRGFIEHGEGRFNPAAESLGEAEPYLSLIGARWAIAWSRALLAEAAIVRGDIDTASQQADEGLRLAAMPFARAARPRGHLAAARVAHSRKDRATAEQQAHEALGLDLAGGGCLVAIEALELLAALAIEQGGGARGARLLAAAEAQRRILRYPAPPVEEAALATAIETARSALDDETFAAAWAEGGTLTVDEAAASATRTRRTEHGLPSVG
jgi:ATP/maltotriose-dependent transcriptional regulator MalT